MFTKSTLKFAIPAALLFAGVSANAQNNVSLLNGTETTWAEVVEYFNNKPTEAQLQAAVDTAQAVLNRTPQTITVTDTAYLQTVKDAKTFLDAFNKWANLGGTTDPSSPKIWFTSVYNKITKKNVLNVAFSEVEGLTESTISNFYDKALDTDAPNSALKFAVVNVYLSDTDMVNVSTYDATEEDAQINVLQTVYDFLNSDETKAKYTTEVTNPAYTEAQQALADAKASQSAANNGAYDVITLTGDVTVPAGSTLMNFTGEIDGDNHVFNVASGYLFNTLTGTVKNAAVNGNFARATEGTVGEGETATTKKATIENVAVWTGKAGTMYDAKGTSKAYTSLAELAFADRANYGVTEGKLAAVTDANKVYSITVYSSDKVTDADSIFVTSANGAYTNLVTNKAVTVGPNVFVKSATNDLEGTNVFTGSDGNYTAKEVVITDTTNFYCPVDITAETLSYHRTFKKGHATVCLPFAVSDANFEGHALISTFKAQEGKSFQFDYQPDGVQANEPFLLTVESDTELTGLSNVELAQTLNQLVEGKNGAYGLYKETPYMDITTASKKANVFGLQGNVFNYATAGVKFPAFRMVIAGEIPADGPAAAPARIVILGQDGQEVDMSGVDNVATDAAELEVVGGVG